MKHLLDFEPTAISCEYAIGHKFHTVIKDEKTAFVSQFPNECYMTFWINKERLRGPQFEGTIQECAKEMNIFFNQ